MLISAETPTSKTNRKKTHVDIFLRTCEKNRKTTLKTIHKLSTTKN
jgi:hypothetical protein